MLKKCKTGVICLVIFSLVLCSSFIFAFLGTSDIADALLPASYVEEVINKDFEWWTADDYLGLSKLKTTVHSWLGNSAYDFDYLKANPIIIAVIDSGVSIEHELFSGKYGSDGKSDMGAVDSNGVGLYDVLLRDENGNPILKNTVTGYGYKDNDITDDEKQNHGTHVAGIVATLIHALDLEQYIKILPIKASHRDSFAGSDVKSAIEFAIAHGADVINMSLSSDGGSSFAGLDKSDAYKKAVLVAAAGNDGKKIKRYPAALPNVIGVMNYTHLNDGEIALSNTSNYGEWTNAGYDLCASGTKIYSANGSINQENGYEYKWLSGTSMASPVVAFGAALAAMKYRALAGETGEEIGSVELAELVRNAYSTVVTSNESGSAIGSYKVFDMNALVGVSVHDANIEISDLSLLKQRLGDLKPIDFKLNVLPTSEYGNGSVEWFAGDEKIGSGFEISYTPKSEVGETTVKAVWKHQSDEHGEIEQSASVKISVDYMSITAVNVAKFEIVASENGIELDSPYVLVGHTYRLTVDGIQNISPNDANNCLWFVNDEFQHVGPNFNLTPKDVGFCRVYIRINGYASATNVLRATYQEPEKESQGLIKFTVIFCIAISAAMFIIAAAIFFERRRNKNR